MPSFLFSISYLLNNPKNFPTLSYYFLYLFVFALPIIIFILVNKYSDRLDEKLRKGLLIFLSIINLIGNLIILLLLISALFIPYDPVLTKNPAVVEIGNLISSGKGISSDFELKQGEVVRAEYYSQDKGIDPCSIYFDSSAFPDILIELSNNQKFDPENNCENTMFKNSTSRSVYARARIIFDESAKSLQSTVNFIEMELNIEPQEFWKEEPGFEQVCVIILERAR